MSLAEIQHPILYSTMTAVAYNINIKFNSGLHYMWCTPYFGSDYKSPHFTVPPSSSPLEIYKTIQKEIEGGDLHSSKIELNRMGIRKGAEAMLKRNAITEEAYKDIIVISKVVPMHQFRPLLCGNRSGGGSEAKINCGAEALTYFLVISLQPKSDLRAARGRI